MCSTVFEEEELNHCLTDVLYFGSPNFGFCTLKELHTSFLKRQFCDVSLQQVSLGVPV